MKDWPWNQRIGLLVSARLRRAAAGLARRAAAGAVCALAWVVLCLAGVDLGFPRIIAAAESGDGATRPAATEEAIDPAMPGLIEAIDNDDVARLKAILDAHPGLLEKPVQAGAPIKPALVAALDRRVNVMKYLFAQGIQIKDFDPQGNLVWMCAYRGYADMLELLLRHGADANHASIDGRRSLEVAMGYGHESCVEVLIQHGAGLPPDSQRSSLLLLMALAGGSPANARTLKKMGADIRLRANDGRTAWHFATKSSAPAEMFAIVQESGLDISARDDNGLTPLMLYVDRRIACDEDRDDEPQIASYEQGWRFLAEHGVDIKAVTDQGETALHFAARSGERRTIQLCLEAGLDVNARTTEGLTPLDIAIEDGNMAAAVELLAQGGQARLTCEGGASPLQRVFGIPGPKGFVRGSRGQYDHPYLGVLPADLQIQVITGLIRMGCDPNIESPWGTPLGIACGLFFKKSLHVEALLDGGADPNQLSAGETPLALAVQGSKLRIVELLLEHGANPRLPDPKTGETPLETLLSRSRGDPLFNILWRLDISNKPESTAILLCIYTAQQTPVNVGVLAVFALVVLGAGLWIRRWISVHGAGFTGAGAEATLDEISARADWQELLAKFEEAQAFQRRVFLHRPWILIGAFGWVFGIGFFGYDPILNLLVQPQWWWYVALFTLAFLVSCGLQFARASGWRIFGASLGIVALVVGGFFASAAVYVLCAYPRLYLPAGVLALAILATLTAAWRFHRTLKAEMALRRIQLPPGFEFHRKAAADGAEIEPPAGWDEGRG